MTRPRLRLPFPISHPPVVSAGLLCLAVAGAALGPAALAADPAPAAKEQPAADPARQVRPDVAKAINAAREQLGRNAFQESLASLKPALALPDLKPYENLLLNRLQGVSLVGMGDMPAADAVQEKVIADPMLSAEDRKAVERMMAQRWYDKQPYAQAVKWARRLIADGGGDDTMNTVVIQSLFKSEDWKGTIDAIGQVLAADDAAGRKPAEGRLQMLSVCYTKVGDDQGHVAALERLVSLYPKPLYWHNLLANLERKEGFEDYAVIDVYRLREATGTVDTADDFIDWARLAMRAGYPAEARRALDAGVAKGVLGNGKGGAPYETLRKQADKASDEDRALLGQGDARVEKAADGNGLFSNGLNYTTHDRFDQGLPLMERGLDRGGLKHADLARLQLGEAYARAGRKDDALRTMATVKGKDGAGDLARLWTLYLQGNK